MDYVLQGKTITELLEIYYDLCEQTGLTEEDRDYKQDVKAVLYKKGCRF